MSPGRWVELGLVPDHLTDEDFEMLAFERWEDDERAREEAEAKNPAPPARAYRTATRAVGVPPLIGRAADDSASAPASSLEGAASTEPGDEAAAAAAPESAASSAPDASETTTGVSDAPGESAFADAGALAASDDENPFSGLDIPAGFELVQLEGEWCLVETGEQPERVVASNGDVYFFSTDHLSRVRAAALAEWDAVERYRNV